MEEQTNREETLKKLAQFRLMDDTFMRAVLKDDLELTQFILRIILDKPDLIVVKIDISADLKRITGARSVILDVYAEDSQGRKYNIEIQNDDDGAIPKRARYHSSSIDIENLNEGQKFRDLPEVYVIFITENDYFGNGNAVYHTERIVKETEEPFGDGVHIVYVNGQYRGTDPMGDLMHDFHCTRTSDMKYNEIAEKTRYYKEKEKGVEIMCKIMEDWRVEIEAKVRAEERDKAKEEMAEVKEEMAKVKEEMAEVKEEMAEVFAYFNTTEEKYKRQRAKENKQ